MDGLLSSWTDATWFFKLPFRDNLLVSNFQFEQILSIMNCFNVFFHFETNYSHKLKIWMAPFWSWTVSTCCFILKSTIVTNWKFEWLISFMNWCNTLLRTNFTFESSRIFTITKNLEVEGKFEKSDIVTNPWDVSVH